MHKVTSLVQLDIIHLLNEVQQNLVLLTVQTRDNDDIQLFTDNLLAYFGSFSRIVKMPHLPTPLRSQILLWNGQPDPS